MSGKGGVYETKQLFYINLTIEKPTYEGIFNNKLLSYLVARNSNREEEMKSRGLDNWTKGFVVINTYLLIIAKSHQSSFMTWTHQSQN